MPAIEQIQIQPRPDSGRARIQELKNRAAEGLDDALSVVARNLGRQEAAQAETELKGLDLAEAESGVHTLDRARVLELISDPFGDD